VYVCGKAAALKSHFFTANLSNDTSRAIAFIAV